MKDNNAQPLPEYVVEAIQDGYVFECSCGELYNTIDAAWDCRKCRRYLGRSASEVYNHDTEEWIHERDEWAFLDPKNVNYYQLALKKAQEANND